MMIVPIILRRIICLVLILVVVLIIIELFIFVIGEVLSGFVIIYVIGVRFLLFRGAIALLI